MLILRKIDEVLLSWTKDNNRKPLMLRGARQVGKSTSVKQLAQYFEYYVEVNFESQIEVHSFFKGNLDPKSICENLSLYFNTPIVAGKTLVFFDEIQSCMPAISSLRFFYEQLPELHLISAGSLLEFALSELPSFGVGRVRSVFMYPLSFDEFLGALGEHRLIALKKEGNELLLPFHHKLIEYFKKFLLIGGMPEVVSKYVGGASLLEIQSVLDDLLISIRADFVKYKKKYLH